MSIKANKLDLGILSAMFPGKSAGAKQRAIWDESKAIDVINSLLYVHSSHPHWTAGRCHRYPLIECHQHIRIGARSRVGRELGGYA
jgi:hypothetical protein